MILTNNNNNNNNSIIEFDILINLILLLSYANFFLVQVKMIRIMS